MAVLPRAAAGLLLFAVFVVWFTPAVADDSWDPVSPAELAAAIPPAERDANAVVLFSRVNMRYSRGTSTKECYRRTKIHTAKGAADAQKLAFEYQDFVTLSKLAARIVRPDGSSIEYSERNFESSTVVKFAGVKRQTKRLILPELGPGDILEYRWRESFNGWANYLAFFCQEQFPVRDYDLTVTLDANSRLEVAWYNIPRATTDQKKNTIRIRAAHVPAFTSEPEMPPELNIRGVIIVSFDVFHRNPAEGWAQTAGLLADLAAPSTRPNGAVQSLAARLAAGAASDEEKLRRFYDYCQTQITNVDYDGSAESVALRKKLEEPREPGAIAKARRGNSREINLLFAALARAAGFDVRLAASARRDFLLSPDIPNGWHFITPRLIAVRSGDSTRFFSPGDRFVPFGRLRWQDEGAEALISDRKNVLWARTPATPPSATRTLREATLTLDAEGALEGDVTLTLTGHAAIEWRDDAWNLSNEARNKSVRDPLIARLPNALVTDIRFEDLTDAGRPLVIKYHLRVPDYCPPSGSRMLVVPNVFESGATPRFNSPSRVYPVQFPYSHEVHDRITLALPAAGDLDRIDPLERIGDSDRWMSHDVAFDYDPDRRVLQYRRDHHLGVGGPFIVPAANYPSLKDVFEHANRAAVQPLVWNLPAPAAP